MQTYSSPISGLPSETTVSILVHAINAVIAEKENVPHFLTNLCLVSKLWQHFVTSARELWCDINLEWPLEQRAHWLEQSTPRIIDVRGLGDISSYEDVLEHASRFSSVTLHKIPPKTMEYFLEDLERYESLPNLKSMVLECDILGQGQAHYFFPDDFPHRAPKFRSLSISVLVIPNIDFVAADLTRLEIYNSIHAAEDLMSTIAQCKNLEHLALGGLYLHGPYERGRLTMPTLQSLVLSKGNNQQTVEVVLGIGRFGPATAHLRAPSLRCFFLWYDGPCDVRFTNAVSAFLRESPDLCTLGLSGDDHKGPIPTLAKLPGLGCVPLPTVPADLTTTEEGDEIMQLGAQDTLWHTSWMNDQLLVPSLQHLILDGFIPSYKVQTGDRFHRLITTWLMFRLGLPIARHLKRLTLEGWKDESIREIKGTNELGKIVSIDASMRGGLLPRLRPVET